MVVLRSYVNGSWFTPADEGAPLYDAVTGEEVARISSAGFDMAAALEYGRRRAVLLWQQGASGAA